MKLSLCIATYNEEKFIHYPLDCAIDLVDEVIIVDGGSTDRTVEVAKKYGEKVKVFVEDNPPMFHINKQKAIERAGGEWILQLDADEELSEELRKEIRSIVMRESVDSSSSLTTELANERTTQTSSRFANSNYLLQKDNRAIGGERGRAPDSAHLRTLCPRSTSGRETLDRIYRDYVAYYIPRKNFFLTRFLEKGGQYPDYTIRLYKRGVAHFPCKSVHENVKVNPAFGEAKGEVGYLKGPLLHYADFDFQRYLKRWNRYTTLDAETLYQEFKVSSFVPLSGTSEDKQNSKFKVAINFIKYFCWKPKVTFFSMYVLHKGFLDGFPGFVFALFSSIRFWAIYIKAWQKNNSK